MQTYCKNAQNAQLLSVLVSVFLLFCSQQHSLTGLALAVAFLDSNCLFVLLLNK